MTSKQHLSLQNEMSKTDSNNYSSTIRAQSATGSEKIGVVMRVISESSRRGSRLAERAAAAAAAAMVVVQAAEEDTQAFQTAGQAEW